MQETRRPWISTCYVLCILGWVAGCGGSSTNAAKGTGSGPVGGGHAGTGGFSGTERASAGVGGSLGPGGAITGQGGRSDANGGTTSAVGGKSVVGTGGASALGGSRSGAGDATSATGGRTAGSGGVSATGGGTLGSGGLSAVGGSPSSSGGTTSAAGGKTVASGGVSGTGGGGGGATVASDAIYAAPDGSESAAGTLENPTTLASAVAKANAGSTIYLRGGKYALTTTVGLSKSGTSSASINLLAYPLDEQRPLLDFSGQATGKRGLSLSGSYWRLYGIDTFAAGDNCLYISGSNNLIEFMTFSECEDSGLQIGKGAANNTVLNCDSYFNADATLENADGFAAKLDVGSGNKFVGCRAWNNLDDGWDGYLRGADNVSTTYENCWAIDNGKLKSGAVGAGDGNGFKSGGSDDKDLRHNATYIRCIAAGNVHDGFDHNSNRGNVTLRNCAAHDNGSNINFSATNIAASLTIKNTISLGSNGELNASTKDITNNSWQNGLSATAADFASVDTALLKSKRKADGSLPEIDYFKLVSGSDLRNSGVDVGLPYKGSAPDLGPFESAE